MKDFERRENGKLYIPANEDNTTNHWNVIRKACKEFNDSNFWEDDSALKNLQNYFIIYIPSCQLGGFLLY